MFSDSFTFNLCASIISIRIPKMNSFIRLVLVLLLNVLVSEKEEFSAFDHSTLFFIYICIAFNGSAWPCVWRKTRVRFNVDHGYGGRAR